jgi:Activator of Hsp90 ATPase homolog 1-like protein
MQCGGGIRRVRRADRRVVGPSLHGERRDARGVTIEPRVGGRVYATHSDIGEDEWSEVTVWEPGQRPAHTFTLAQDPAQPSEVAVEFSAAGDGCSMRFAHGGWSEANAAARPKFGDWRVILDRFAALVQV